MNLNCNYVLLISIFLGCTLKIYAVDLQDCNKLYQRHNYSEYIDKCTVYAQSDVNTAMNLADLYSNGSNEVIVNSQNRIINLKQAATLGSYKAQGLLCTGYFDGSIGYVNYEQSFWWCEKFSTRNEVKPKLVLASEYKSGLGTSKNLQKAKAIYLDLAKNGNSDAQYNLAEIFIEEHKQQDGYYWLKQAYKSGKKDAVSMVDKIIDSSDCDSEQLYFEKGVNYKKAFAKCHHIVTGDNELMPVQGSIGDYSSDMQRNNFDASSVSDVSSLFNLIFLGQ